MSLLILLVISCSSSEKTVYFQEHEGLKINDSIVGFSPKIQVGDLLTINLSAVDAEATFPFNLYETPLIDSNATNAKPITYLVNEDGGIHFPVNGKFNVEGLTTKQNNEKTIKIPEDYIYNPIIKLGLTNFKVTIMREITSPDTYPIPDERISILDAIGLAGDLTICEKRKNITLIREQDGKRLFVTLDLMNKELFNSSYLYLTQQDIICVEPNKTNVNSSAIWTNTAAIIYAVSIIISIVTILTN